MHKFLQALLKRFQHIVVAIETLLDLKVVSLDELVGQLKVTKQYLDHTKGRGGDKEIDVKLHFTKE